MAAAPLLPTGYTIIAGMSDQFLNGASNPNAVHAADNDVKKVNFVGADGVLGPAPLSTIPELAKFVHNNMISSVRAGNVFPIGPYGLPLITYDKYNPLKWITVDHPISAVPPNPDEGAIPLVTRSHRQEIATLTPYAVQVRLSPQEIADAASSQAALFGITDGVMLQLDACAKETLCTIAMGTLVEVPNPICIASQKQLSPLHLWNPVTYFQAMKNIYGCGSRGDGGLATALGWTRQIREQLFLPETNVLMLHASTAALVTMDNREAFLGGQEGIDRFNAGVPGLKSFRDHTVGVASTYRTADLQQGGNVLESISRTGEFYLGHDPSIRHGPLVRGKGGWGGVQVYNEDMDAFHTITPEEMVEHAVWWDEKGDLRGEFGKLVDIMDEDGSSYPADAMLSAFSTPVTVIGNIHGHYLDVKTIAAAAEYVKNSIPPAAISAAGATALASAKAVFDAATAAEAAEVTRLDALSGKARVTKSTLTSLKAAYVAARGRGGASGAGAAAAGGSGGGPSVAEYNAMVAEASVWADLVVATVDAQTIFDRLTKAAGGSGSASGKYTYTGPTSLPAIDNHIKRLVADGHNDIELLGAAVAWLGVPFATKRDHLALLRSGLPYPLQFMLIRDDIRRVMASAVIYAKDCGTTLVSHVQAVNATDESTHNAWVSYKWRAGAFIPDKQKVQVLEHVSYLSYNGGKGVRFAKPEEWLTALESLDRNPDRGDIYVVGQALGAMADVEYCSLLGYFDLKGFSLQTQDKRNTGDFQGRHGLFACLNIKEVSDYRRPRDEYMKAEQFNINLARGTARNPSPDTHHDVWCSGTATLDGPAYVGCREVHQGKSLSNDATQRLMQTRTAAGR